jgi:hypothetical protein
MNAHQPARFMPLVVWHRWVSLAMLLWLGSSGSFAGAATPRLEFDVPFSISCRPVPCTDPARKDPEKDVIEVILPISVRLRAGTEKDLKECLYILVDPTEPAALSVRDWLPRTELKTEFAKPIQINQERLAKVGITLSAHYTVTASGDVSGQTKSGVAYEMLPPQEIVLASGTVHDAHGVFFKLKPSTQTTLEGMKAFSVIFAVPRGWRGGCLKLQCEAIGLNRGLVRILDRELDCGQAVFSIALHLAGDGEAEALADRVAACQQELMDCLPVSERKRAPVRDVFLPVLCRLLEWPRHLAQQIARTDEGPARDEPACIDYGLDRGTVHAMPLGNLPSPLSEKLRALEKATEALQNLSTASILTVERSERSLHGQTVSPVQRTDISVSTGGAIKRVSATVTPFTAASARRSDGSNNEGAFTAASLPMSKADEHQDGSVQPSAHARLSPTTDSTAKPLPRTSGRTPASEEQATLPEPASQSRRFPNDSSKRVWYILASVGGGMFTCIFASLVVEVIRKRMHDRQQQGTA